MPASAQSTLAQALRRAAVRATLAPSVRNTQPWRFVIGGGALEIHADHNRLQNSDPDGRQTLISCGCALFNARVSLAAAGHQVRVERFPDPSRPAVLARVTIGAPAIPTRPDSAGPADLGRLDAVIETRRTNRRRFTEDAVPAHAVERLLAAAAEEGARLVPITRPEHRLSLAVLLQQAAAEGDAESDLLAQPGPAQCLLLLCTDTDSPAAWLRAGEALEHALLQAADDGLAVSPTTRVAEVSSIRAMLGQELRLTARPHVLLRVGRAPATPATRRRRLVDMLVEAA
jgi:hypothetical protein